MDQLIRQALARWGWSEDSACVLLAERENRVYRIEPLETGSNAALPIKSLVLRIHRQDYRSDAELNSELQWMSYLADCGMAVPKPIASTSGEYGEVVDGWQIDCLSLLDGVPLGSTGQALELEDRLGTFRRIGQTMARLHQLTDAWQLPDDFTRPHWNEAGLLGEQPLWGRFWENPKLTKPFMWGAKRSQVALCCHVWDLRGYAGVTRMVCGWYAVCMWMRVFFDT